jgi:hypothetical protein
MSLLKDRDFLLLFAGQGISRFGDGLYTAATAWPARSPTKDPTAVAVVAAASILPALDLLNLPLLVATTALLALIGAPFAPARYVIVTQIMPDDRLQQANGLLQVAFRAAALVVNGLTFLGSAAAVTAIRVTRPAPAGAQTGLWSEGVVVPEPATVITAKPE